MKKIIQWLFILFHPSFWIMNYPFDKAWDRKFIKLMSDYKFTDINYYYAKLGNMRLGIQNYPYASFTLYDEKENNPFKKRLTVRPSRWTIYQARQKLRRDWLESKGGWGDDYD